MSKFKTNPNFHNFCKNNIEKQMVRKVMHAEEVWFEWSHQRILSTDSKVITMSIIDCESTCKRVKFYGNCMEIQI